MIEWAGDGRGSPHISSHEDRSRGTEITRWWMSECAMALGAFGLGYELAALGPLRNAAARLTGLLFLFALTFADTGPGPEVLRVLHFLAG